MSCFIESENLLPKEQKGCRKESRGAKDQLLINKTIPKDCRKRRTNLAMAWINYRKAYDFVSHSWVLECLDMLGTADNDKSMKKWKILLNSNGSDLCEVDVNRAIFQGGSLSPLTFVICMIPLSFILRKVKASYEWGRKEFKLNHLLFMDDLKLFGKSVDQIDSLVQTVFTCSEDVSMEFALKKCGVVILKKGKLVKGLPNGIRLANQEIMKEVDQNGYTYFRVILKQVTSPTHPHSPPVTLTHPHPPKIYLHPPPNHPHLPIKNVHPPPPTQNIPPPTPTHL